MPVTPSPADILRRNRERATAFAQAAGGERTRKILERAQKDLEQRLAEAEGLKGPGKDSFTAVQLNVTKRQIEDVLRVLKAELRGEIVTSGKATAEAEAEGLLDYLKQADEMFRGVVQPLPINEARMLDRVVQGTEASILARIAADPEHKGHKGVLDRYGDAVIERFEEQLQLRFLSRKPWAEVRDAITAESTFLQDAPAYWAERIVRTETIAANNRAGWETVRAADSALGDMVKILCATFDHRTSADSYAVHGQIRRPAEAFESWFGLYQHPPNRPNDREVVVPHRIAWPIPPELKPKSDAEVAARWAYEKRKGSPPKRPRMTTVPLELFGVQKPPAIKAPAPPPIVEQAPPEVFEPVVLPANLHELVRPLPRGDFESQGHLEAARLAESALAQLAASPAPYIGGDNPVAGAVYAPYAGAMVDPATGKVPKILPSKIHGSLVNAAKKKQPSSVAITEISSAKAAVPFAWKDAVEAHIKHLGKPAPVTLVKHGGKLWLYEESGDGPVITAAYFKGATHVDAHVIDLDAKAEKDAKKAAAAAKKEAKSAALAQVPPMQSRAAPILDSDVVLAKRVGDAKGSNDGGTFRGSDGVLRYVKFYKDKTQAASEHLANAIYNDLGIGGPKSNLVRHGGSYAYASEIMEGKTLREAGLTREHAAAFMKGFAADVLTANWDAVGMGKDNAFVLPDGRVIRIDSGGTFTFRAKAGKKAEHFLKSITEWEGFFNPSLNRDYLEVAEAAGIRRPKDFGAALVEQIGKIKALRDREGGWAKYVDRIVGDAMSPSERREVADMLEERTKLLDKKLATLTPSKGTPEPKRPASKPVVIYSSGEDEIGKKAQALVREVERDGAKRAAVYKKIYTKAGLTERQLEKAQSLISDWTAGYKDSPTQKKCYAAFAEVTKLGTPQQSTDTLTVMTTRNAVNSRRARWRAMLEHLGHKDAEAPEFFDIRRGVKGMEFVKAVARAWEDDGVENVKLETYELASWSFDRKVAQGYASQTGSGVIARWMHCPIENTVFDQVVDDSTFTTTFGPSSGHEAEIIAGPGHRKGLSLPKHDQEVVYKGKTYAYDEREELLEAMRRNRDL